MNGQPHLFKRGNVYQWRRRIRRQSTGIIDFKLSLGTTDLPEALILCRKISAESDIVMQEFMEHGVTAEEARLWLAEVIRKERAIIDRNGLFKRVSARDPEAEDASDERVRRAWAHIAHHGIHAAPPEDADDGLKLNLNFFREDLSSHARRFQITKEFAELTGRSDVSALGKMTLLDLLIAGRNAAWNENRSSSQLCKQLLKNLEAPSTDQAPPTPKTWEASHELEPKRPLEDLQNESEIDSSIFAVIERMNAYKREEGIEEKTLNQFVSFATLFVRLTGIEDVRQIRQTHASKFRAEQAKTCTPSFAAQKPTPPAPRPRPNLAPSPPKFRRTPCWNNFDQPPAARRAAARATRIFSARPLQRESSVISGGYPHVRAAATLRCRPRPVRRCYCDAHSDRAADGTQKWQGNGNSRSKRGRNSAPRPRLPTPCLPDSRMPRILPSSNWPGSSRGRRRGSFLRLKGRTDA